MARRIAFAKILTMDDTATIRFVWRELASHRDLGTCVIARVALDAGRGDLPLLASVDELAPALFRSRDMRALEGELARVLAERPRERRDIEAALALVRSCAATPGTELLAVAQ